MCNIKLISSDGKIFDVDVEVAKKSMFIKTMIEDLGLDMIEDEPIPLPNVSTQILIKVVQWATYHKNDHRNDFENENAEIRTDDISEWDHNFMDAMDEDTLIALMLAANYLDIKGLLDVTSKTIASIREKTPEEVLEDYKIPPASV